MDKIATKIFALSRSGIHFLKMFIIFLIMMLILYWIQNLLGWFWNWTEFLNPFFNLLLDIGEKIAPGSMYLFEALFEYKYFVAIALLIIFYFFANFLIFITDQLEICYFNTALVIRKHEEKNLNKMLENETKEEQVKLKKYKIYVLTSIKKATAHREYNVNLEEQNRIMLKFLIEKTNCSPSKKDEGFLFEFNDFERIDTILDSFNKLIQSKAPLDYIICLQVFGEDASKELNQMEVLKNLKILNKIVSFADTAYRYSFNRDKGYTVSQLGLFQKEGTTFEVHEYIKKPEDIKLV